MNKPTSKAKVVRAATFVVLTLLLLGGILFFCAQKGLFGAYLYNPQLKTLLYHLVADETYGDYHYLFVRTADFEKQLQEIKRRGLQTYFADEPAKARGKEGIVLTFDDGYEDNYTTAFPLLKKYQMKATIFLIADLIGTKGYLTAEQISEMQASGLVRFGSHTSSHPDLSALDTEALNRELAESKARLEALTGAPVKALAYPGGKYNDEVCAAARRAGYRYAYTTDVPTEAYFENTKLPRHYVVRDMPWEEFLLTLEPSP